MTDREDTNIWPGFSYQDAHAMRGWLAALGFEEGVCVPGDTEGVIMHSEMLWPEGGRVMISTRTGTKDPTFADQHGSCYVVTASPDEVFARAQALGAEVVREMEETDYGSRGFSIVDVEGNGWSFGTYAGLDS